MGHFLSITQTICDHIRLQASLPAPGGDAPLLDCVPNTLTLVSTRSNRRLVNNEPHGLTLTVALQVYRDTKGRMKSGQCGNVRVMGRHSLTGGQRTQTTYWLVSSIRWTDPSVQSTAGIDLSLGSTGEQLDTFRSSCHEALRGIADGDERGNRDYEAGYGDPCYSNQREIR